MFILTMAPKVYMSDASPAARGVLITAGAIGLELDLVRINLATGEHMKPEYLKLNPQHTVPTLVDSDGFTIWDSNVIIEYLHDKYAKNDALFPKDLKKRAVINQRLHFNNATLYSKILEIFLPCWVSGKTEITEDDAKLMAGVYDVLNIFLEGQNWVANNTLSVADYAIYPNISSVHKIIPVTQPNVLQWMKRCEALPECQINKKGHEEYVAMYNAILKKFPAQRK